MCILAISDGMPAMGGIASDIRWSSTRTSGVGVCRMSEATSSAASLSPWSGWPTAGARSTVNRTTFYVDGKAQGASEGISEAFSWDMSTATIRLGVNYVGLWDELAVFSRALSEEEVTTLHNLEGGAAELR